MAPGGPLLQKGYLSHRVPVPAPPCRLAGAGGRKKIFRLSDVLKPLTDAQVEAMKLGAVKRILRAEKAVACSGAAQVCPGPPSPFFPALPPPARLISRERHSLRPKPPWLRVPPVLPASPPCLASVPLLKVEVAAAAAPVMRKKRTDAHGSRPAQGGCAESPASEGCRRVLSSWWLIVLFLSGSDGPGLSADSATCWRCNLSQATFFPFL